MKVEESNGGRLAEVGQEITREIKAEINGEIKRPFEKLDFSGVFSKRRGLAVGTERVLPSWQRLADIALALVWGQQMPNHWPEDGRFDHCRVIR